MKFLFYVLLCSSNPLPDTNIFREMTSLNFLDFSHNNIRMIPSSIGCLNALSYLKIEPNSFDGLFGRLAYILRRRNRHEYSKFSVGSTSLCRNAINENDPIDEQCAILRFISHMRDQFELESIAREFPYRELSSLFDKQPSHIYCYKAKNLEYCYSSEERKNIIQELLHTERTYVDELDTVFYLYYNGIKSMNGIPKAAILTLFSNFISIRTLHKL